MLSASAPSLPQCRAVNTEHFGGEGRSWLGRGAALMRSEGENERTKIRTENFLKVCANFQKSCDFLKRTHWEFL